MKFVTDSGFRMVSKIYVVRLCYCEASDGSFCPDKFEHTVGEIDIVRLEVANCINHGFANANELIVVVPMRDVPDTDTDDIRTDRCQATRHVLRIFVQA